MPIGSIIAAVVLAYVYNSKTVEENAHNIDICLAGYLVMIGVSIALDMPTSFVMSKNILIQSFLGGLFCGLLHDEEIKDTFIITLEENSLIGGFGSLVQNYYLDKNIAVKIKCMGIKDEFINHGSVAIQLKQNGFTRENLLDIIEKG
jgi:1-deoxy-D-xylulose-5-phosphate synthase